MVYGYARVSTSGQSRDGNSLKSQEQLLTQNGAQEIYADRFTGVKRDRPQLNALIAKLTEGDTLIVTKLDRIARSLTEGIILVDSIIQKNVRVHILNIGVMDDTPSSKLVRGIFFSFAEFERDMIAERTSEGKAIARTKDGFREGRPLKYTPEQLRHALELLEEHSYKQVSVMTKISKSTLQRAKRKAGKATPPGRV